MLCSLKNTISLTKSGITPKPLLPSWVQWYFDGWKYQIAKKCELPQFSIDQVAEEVVHSHRTEIITKNQENLEQNLADIAWFLSGLRVDYNNVGYGRKQIKSKKRDYERRVKSQREITTLFRYYGRGMRLQRGHLAIDLLPKMINGVLRSRPTGALSEDFLVECLDRKRKKQAPEEIYKDMIGSALDPRFKFAYYNEHNYDADLLETAGFLLYIQVRPALQGLRYSGRIIKEILRYYHFEKGFNYAFAFGRLANIHRTYLGPEASALDLQNYIQRQGTDGLHPDHTIKFHQKAGGEVIVGLPFNCKDDESHNHGVLIIYDLKQLEKAGGLEL